MTDLWTSSELAAALSGTPSDDFTVRGIEFDSREVSDGDLFFALKGEQSDGHLYLDKAFEQGGAGAVVSQAANGPHILVDDTILALDNLARAARARGAAKIIGVTGSVGKTGTKEALFAALDRISNGKAHRSLKSYNNHVGVPLSLSRMPRDSSFGIFEMGMNHPGELAQLTQLVRPDVAIITTIAPAHVGFFKDESAIADAKAEIFSGLTQNGTAIIPFDSPHYQRLHKAASQYTQNIISFGMNEGAMVRATEAIALDEGGTLVTAHILTADGKEDRNICYTIAEPGVHWVANSLAIMAAVYALNSDLARTGLALAELSGLAGRGQRHSIETPDSKTALLIDESYNANPASMRATLQQLRQSAVSGRRIAVLGMMGELGDASQKYHEELADDIRAADIDYVIMVGDDMQFCVNRLNETTDEPQQTGIAFDHVANAAEALPLVVNFIVGGDAILIKGSNYLGLAALVSALVSGEY